MLSCPTERLRCPVIRLTRPRLGRSVRLTNDHPAESAQSGGRGARRERAIDGVFIQADLPRRVGLDTRRSVVLYDGNFVFNYALDALPNERALRALFHRTPVRYWSKGVV